MCSDFAKNPGIPSWINDRAARNVSPIDTGGSEAVTNNPNASQSIRPLEAEHLSQVVAIFREVFPENTLSHLGEAFLRELLASYARQPGGCGFVFVKDDVVAGFIVGATDSRDHRRALLRQRWTSLLQHTVRALLRSPSLVLPLTRYLRASLIPSNVAPRRISHASTTIPSASLVFLGVAPTHRQLGIATILTETFLTELVERGAESVKLIVGKANHQALRFYLRRGWRVSGCYPSPSGDLAYRLVYDLPAPIPKKVPGSFGQGALGCG